MKSPCRGCQREFQDKNAAECVGCDKRMAYWQALGSLNSNVPDEMTDYVGSVGPFTGSPIDPLIENCQPSAVDRKLTPDDINYGIDNGWIVIPNAQYQSEEKPMTKKQAEYTATKVCSRPSCEHGGKSQPLDNFHKATKGKYGRQSECKRCRRLVAQEYFKRKERGEKKEVKQKVKLRSEITAGVILPADPAPSALTPPSPNGRGQGRWPGEQSLTLDFSGFPAILAKIKKIAAEEIRSPENQAIYILKQGVGM